MANKHKKSPLRFVYFAIEMLFIGVIPALLVILNYASWSEEATGFKIGFTGILLLVVIFLILKKLVFKQRLEKMKAALAQHEADLDVENDPEKIENLVSEVRKGRLIETVINYIPVFLIMIAIYLMAQALEKASVVLSGTIGFCFASVLVGFIISMIDASTMR